MTEEKYRIWDILVKCLGILGATSSFLWGVYQYMNSQEKALIAESIARDRVFAEEIFKRRLDELQSIALVTSKFSAPPESEESFNVDVKKFERLYWGTIATIESKQVLMAMDYLRSGIENYKLNRIMLGDTKPEDQLKKRARALIRAIRSAINKERELLIVVQNKSLSSSET